MSVPNRREVPRYAFLAERLEVEKEDGTGSKVFVGPVMVNVSKSGMCVPGPGVSVVPGDKLTINCGVYTRHLTGKGSPRWKLTGEARHTDTLDPATNVGYIGVKVTDIKRADRKILDAWLSCFAAYKTAPPNPHVKDELETWGVIINSLGVALGIVALVFDWARPYQKGLLWGMIGSILIYMSLRGWRGVIERKERKSWQP